MDFIFIACILALMLSSIGLVAAIERLERET
jgi:hypothetical protein